MAISRIEFLTGNYPNTANGTVAITLGTATVAGELIVVGLFVQNGSGSPAVTDSAGGTYTQIFLTANIGASGENITGAMYYLENAPAGITSVTVKESASAGHGTAWMAHYTGIATSGSLDTSATFPGAAGHSPWASTAINTAIANELLVGSCLGVRQAANSVMTLSGSWNSFGTSTGANFDGNNGNEGIVGDQIVSSIQSGVQFTGTDTGGANVDNYAGIAAFKALSSSGHFLSCLGAGG